jgi:tetratricopeptide (TPR) repeat protein
MKSGNRFRLIFAISLILTLRGWAAPEGVSPFSNPDPFSPVKQFTAEEQREIDTGVKLVREHKPEAAIAFYREHAKSHPDRWWLAGLLSQLLLAQGSYQEAYSYASSALRNSGSEANRVVTISLLTYKGTSAYKLGRFQDSLDCYLQITQVQPKNPVGYAMAAKILLGFPKASDRARALPLAQKANELSNRKSPLVLDILAETYAATGDKRNAISSEQQAVRCAPQKYKGYFQSRLQIYTVD